MAWGIDNQEPWNISLNRIMAITFHNLFNEFVLGEEGSTDLLGDSSCFILLDTCSSDLIEDRCLACIDVTQNTTNGRSISLVLIDVEILLLVNQNL